MSSVPFGSDAFAEGAPNLCHFSEDAPDDFEHLTISEQARLVNLAKQPHKDQKEHRQTCGTASNADLRLDPKERNDLQTQ